MVKVSVVALPTRVSVAAGRVNVPEAVALAEIVVCPLVEPLKLIPVEIDGEFDNTTWLPDPVYELT